MANAILSIRDFLMRTALFQSNEFARDDLRREARRLLKTLDQYLMEEQAELGAIAAEKVPDTPDVRQAAPDARNGERRVNQHEQRPNFNAYFPSNEVRRGPGRPRKVAPAA